MKIKYIFLFILSILPASLSAQTWTQQSSGTTQILESVFMLNENEGWIAGDAGTLLRTVNGGANWTQIPVTNQDLADVAFRDPLTGIVVGDDGFVIRTTNGGLNWSIVSSGTSANLASVTWATTEVVFVSGRDGAALISLNAGESFTVLNTGSTARYRGGYASGSRLWAVGEDGIIRYSSNNGINWVSQPSPASDDLQDIQFLNAAVGFAGGSSETMIYTSDGGTTWVTRSAGINFGINGIYFINENTGWAASEGGIIYSTTNGGLNWTGQNLGNNFEMNEVHFPTANKGWVVGENGLIFFYDSGVPVELSSFTSEVTGTSVRLLWSTASETNNAGFEIQRKLTSSENWIPSGFITGSGSSAEIHNYQFTDNNLEAGSYNYRIKQLDYNGSYEFYVLSNEITIAAVNEYSLGPNYPNPFNPSTTINFTMGSDGEVTIKVYNTIGKEVAVLLSGHRTAGKHSVNFDAGSLSSGIYLYKIEAADFVQVRKMTLLK